MPPVACGRILANYEPDLIASLNSQILREDFQVKVVAAKIMSKVSLANHIDLAELALVVLARSRKISLHHPWALIGESNDLIKIFAT